MPAPPPPPQVLPDLVEEIVEAILNNVDLTSQECQKMMAETSRSRGAASSSEAAPPSHASGRSSAALEALRSFHPFLQVGHTYDQLQANRGSIYAQ